MIRKIAFVAVFLFILVDFVFKVSAQPTLPDIAGALEKGVIILTWDCQYDGIKSIAVQRSSDSVHNFKTVGYVQQLKKGVQVFVDGHPGLGKNWYELFIVFNSGLTWNSNRIKIFVDSATLINQQVVLPPNDSLQKLVVAREATDKPIKSKKTGIVVIIDSSATKKQDETTIDISSITGGHDVFKPVTKDSGTTFFPEAFKSNTTLVNNTTSGNITTSSAGSDKPVKHISISINTDPSELNPYVYIKSRFIFTNPLTGHVNMELPQIKEHRYSVKFFDNNNHVIVDIPRIMASPLIIDKRNFQNKGIYKFELRRDESQFDVGYITIY
jgi:hypothetical protein